MKLPVADRGGEYRRCNDCGEWYLYTADLDYPFVGGWCE